MPLCQICFTEQSNPNPCKCVFCLNCLLGWIAVDDAKISIKCPNASCNYKYPIEKISEMCSKQPYQETLQDILTKNYLKTDDIRPCPKCKNYGWVTADKCEENLQCEACNYSWTDISVLPDHLVILMQSSQIIKEVKNHIFLFLRTSECPACGTEILKNGGCSHMTCKRCNHYFCWHCKGDLKANHKTCQVHLITFYGYMLYLSLVLLHSCGILPIISLLWYPFSLFLTFILIHTTLGFLVGAIVVTFLQLTHMNRGTFQRIWMFLGASALFVATFGSHTLLQYFYEFSIWNYVVVVSTEIILTIITYTSYAFLAHRQIRYLITSIVSLVSLYLFGLGAVTTLAWMNQFILILIGKRPHTLNHIIHYATYPAIYYLLPDMSTSIASILIVDLILALYLRKR